MNNLEMRIQKELKEMQGVEFYIYNKNICTWQRKGIALIVLKFLSCQGNAFIGYRTSEGRHFDLAGRVDGIYKLYNSKMEVKEIIA